MADEHTTAATNGPRRIEDGAQGWEATDDEILFRELRAILAELDRRRAEKRDMAWAATITALLNTLPLRRVHATIIPKRWSDDQVKRLTRVVNKVVETDEPGLRCVERAIGG